MSLLVPQVKVFLFGSVAVASDDAQVRRGVEQTKLERWCAAHHIESTADLAFYFVMHEEALLEGRAVADAWEQARREVLVRDLFRREQVSQAAAANSFLCWARQAQRPGPPVGWPCPS